MRVCVWRVCVWRVCVCVCLHVFIYIRPSLQDTEKLVRVESVCLCGGMEVADWPDGDFWALY